MKHNGHKTAQDAPGEPPAITAPNATEVWAAREHAGLTQAQAALLVHSTARRWRDWESGTCRMSAAAWELFQIKVNGVIIR